MVRLAKERFDGRSAPEYSKIVLPFHIPASITRIAGVRAYQLTQQLYLQRFSKFKTDFTRFWNSLKKIRRAACIHCRLIINFDYQGDDKFEENTKEFR